MNRQPLHNRPFPCGHSRTLKNIHRYASHGHSRHGERCRRCFNAYMRRYQRRYRRAGRDSWVRRKGWNDSFVHGRHWRARN